MTLEPLTGKVAKTLSDGWLADEVINQRHESVTQRAELIANRLEREMYSES